VSILGGFLIISSGFIERGITLRIINYIEQKIPQFLPSSNQIIIVTILSILSIIIGLGGVSVVLGGSLMFEGHVIIGRILIGLGGGAGIFGFIITFGYSLVTSGISSILIHALYWVGILLAITGVWIAQHS
jgi:hypothetical protein